VLLPKSISMGRFWPIRTTLALYQYPCTTPPIKFSVLYFGLMYSVGTMGYSPRHRSSREDVGVIVYLERWPPWKNLARYKGVECLRVMCVSSHTSVGCQIPVCRPRSSPRSPRSCTYNQDMQPHDYMGTRVTNGSSNKPRLI